jgi:hypothetical protein
MVVVVVTVVLPCENNYATQSTIVRYDCVLRSSRIIT